METPSTRCDVTLQQNELTAKTQTLDKTIATKSCVPDHIVNSQGRAFDSAQYKIEEAKRQQQRKKCNSIVVLTAQSRLEL